MKFKLKNKKKDKVLNYGVYFTYSGTNTNAELIVYEEIGDKLEPMNTNILGEASMYYKDKVYSKVKGRKVALAKLMKRMNQTSAGDKKPEFRLTKKIRERIWKEYFKTHKMI